MNAVRGRVRGGHVELDVALPEGAEVVVFAADDDGAFELDEAEVAEIELRISEANSGDVEPANAVFDRIRRSR